MPLTFSCYSSRQPFLQICTDSRARARAPNSVYVPLTMPASAATVHAIGGFVRYTLRQHLNKIETELNRKLIRSSRKVLAFDTADLERADFKTLLEGFRIALGRAGEPAFMTVEEVRERLSLKRQPSTPFPALAAPAPASPDPEPSPASEPDPQTDGDA